MFYLRLFLFGFILFFLISCVCFAVFSFCKPRSDPGSRPRSIRWVITGQKHAPPHTHPHPIQHTPHTHSPARSSLGLGLGLGTQLFVIRVWARELWLNNEMPQWVVSSQQSAVSSEQWAVAAFNYAKRLLHFALINKRGKQSSEIRSWHNFARANLTHLILSFAGEKSSTSYLD